MKTNQLFLLTGLAAVTLPACVQKDKKGVSEKPMNILYIMCDDHSYQTISAYDHRFIETPNIDRIANEGVRFTNSFVANSLSGPSRASIAIRMALPTIRNVLTAASRHSRSCCNKPAIRLQL